MPFLTRLFWFLGLLGLQLGLSNSTQAQPAGSPSIDSVACQAPHHIFASKQAQVVLQAFNNNEPASDFSQTHTIWVNQQPIKVVFSHGQGQVPITLKSHRTAVHIGLSANGSMAHFTIKKYPGWLTLLPPLVAILLALFTKEVISSLLAGIFSGALLLQSFTPMGVLKAGGRVFDTYITQAFAHTEHASVILFSLMVGGMVALVSANGGMAGIVRRLSKRAQTRARAQAITWLMGMVIFFDDYANTLVVGNTMRPLTDKFKISRQKLAYLVDSTAAPVACLALVTTWIGAELGYIAAVLPQTEITDSAYGVFTGSLRYSFYPILTIVFMGALIISRRDFGPMHSAEMQALHPQASATQAAATTTDDAFESKTSKQPAAVAALLPVLVLIATTLGGLIATGLHATPALPPGGWLLHAGTIIGASDPYAALMWGAAAGIFSALIITLAGRRLTLTHSVEAMLGGFKSMLPAMIILLLAWALAGVIADLNTATYLSGLFGQSIEPNYVPLLAFVLSAVVSFSTGSSWGAMAVVYPLVLPTTWLICQTAGYDLDASQVVFEHTVAAVLGGSVLGDHCSPISDTTILSSLSSGCNHIDHVRTQMPYALAVATVSLLVSGVLFPLGLPWWAMLLVGMAAVVAIVRLAGKPVP